ncbi:hypothetical protein VTO73DRAFT_15241 [Trametes versicolor]
MINLAVGLWSATRYPKFLPRTTMSAKSMGIGTRLLSHIFGIAASETGCGFASYMVYRVAGLHLPTATDRALN